jgi:putative ATPase
VPPHLRGSGYAGAERLGHGDGYVYSHDEPDAVARQQYLPDDLHGRTAYYVPTGRGFEERLRARLEWLQERLGKASPPEV